MESFKLLLKEFDKTIQMYNYENYKNLQDPLSEKEVDHNLNNLEVNDENFKLLFSWKNGFNFSHGDDPHNQIFDFGFLFSLERILKIKDSGIQQWAKIFVPVVGSGDGDYILFNNNKGDNNYGKLYLFSAALLFIDEPISYYDSLYKMIETTIKAYEKKIFEFDSKTKWLNQKTKEFQKLAKEINIKSDYWKLN